jgi:predicted GH43/DUF377 family glycosyl hydrolase
MTTFPYRCERLGTVMEPQPGDPAEAEGVLNPAGALDADGAIVLFPRLVASGNRSVIGRAEVAFTGGVPTGVRRTGVALDVRRSWEHGEEHGGVEDGRITRIDALGQWVMTYVAWGPLGPRTALAISGDLREWRRLGPLVFGYDDAADADLNLTPNKDVVILPEPVTGPGGRPALAVLHRPMWGVGIDGDGKHGAYTASGFRPDGLGIWISYVDLDRATADERLLTVLTGHREIMRPEQPWESTKIGAGAPPVRVREGWLLTYHGVGPGGSGGGQVYRAGAAILDPQDPSRVRQRSAEPLLSPELDTERGGPFGDDVVFPTVLLSHRTGLLCFYGMADRRIGAARLIRNAWPGGS